MQRRRFYAAPDRITGGRITLPSDETHHLSRALRLRPGDEAFVFDGEGREYRCRISNLEQDAATLEIVEELADNVESSLRLTLAQALVKGEKFELIVQKATELGVGAIIPLMTENADVVALEDRTGKRLDRWRRISVEAVKQCGRRQIPQISRPLPLEQCLNDNEITLPDGTALALNERGGQTMDLALGTGAVRSVTAFIGPEGGWSDGELALLTAHGAKMVTLGPRVLRTETAAIVALALIQNRLGDLSR
jgi:16S rRNA (uracil1498-N3)-methyltransferase